MVHSKEEVEMSERFAREVALVAGGTGGLGRAVSLGFLEEGATVVATYRSQKEFDVLRGAAGVHASRLEGHSIDVTSEAAVRQMISSIVAKHGRLDTMTNAVGGYVAGSKLWETESKVFDLMFSLNFYSGYVLARSAVPAMLNQGRGAIVNVASTAAIDHSASAAAYVSSKAAAVAMMDSLAADLKGTGVRANSILPHIIDTEANRKAMPQADFAKWPKPREIAKVILFLCSDEAKLIHGAAIPV
jgi:NAD(P)-dependent dehydrogenase (short-subunit alcohol dehydrogenase family)